MKILVWQWGRRGAGPRYAAGLAASLGRVTGTAAALSLSAQSEVMDVADPPPCDLPFSTYTGTMSLLARLPAAPFQIHALAVRLRAIAPDVAICAMPAALDWMMSRALRRVGIPFLVVVHDANAHPGDRFPRTQMHLQRALIRRSDGAFALTTHVADQLRTRRLLGDRPLFITTLPPFSFGRPPPPPRAHGGKLRLLSFGRLLPYKGLDLLAEALHLLGPRDDIEVRVVGKGPPSAELDRLAAMPNVTVERRWVPEPEVGDLLTWSDVLVLSHRTASQSGGVADAIAAGRWIIGTRVGGITEQLDGNDQARLCPPTPAGLAEAIAGLLANPPATAPPADTSAAWAKMAARMVANIASHIPPR